MTIFERTLNLNGWVLKCKTYRGKLAKRVESYVYENDDYQGFKVRVVLNPKRNDILDIQIENPYYYVGVYESNVLWTIMEDLTNELHTMLKESAEYGV